MQPTAAEETKAVADAVRVTGKVTDSTGQALDDLEVVLEASHRTFDIKKLQRVRRDLVRRVTKTDQNGNFRIEWHANEHFNQFDLVVGLSVRVPTGERFYTLERMPLPQATGGDGQPRLEVVVADTSFLERFRGFVAALDTEDERATYEEMGIPAKIDRMKLATHEEITWWYFEAGKAYRFRDGRLAEVSEFEPVEPFDAEDEGTF